MRTNITILAAALAVSCSQPSQTTSTASADGTDPPGSALPSAAPPAPIAAGSGGQPAFGAIRADETIRFVGTEPFWGGTISGGEMIYSTPENQAGDKIAVRRFAGNNGLGFSGSLDGRAVDMTITPGSCSDGMSDRTFPFTATLKLGEEQRNGCAWTDRMTFSETSQP